MFFLVPPKRKHIDIDDPKASHVPIFTTGIICFFLFEAKNKRCKLNRRVTYAGSSTIKNEQVNLYLMMNQSLINSSIKAKTAPKHTYGIKTEAIDSS